MRNRIVTTVDGEHVLIRDDERKSIGIEGELDSADVSDADAEKIKKRKDKEEQRALMKELAAKSEKITNRYNNKQRNRSHDENPR